jgi:drug/metabolite transporter (DMT)-like permease
MTKQNNLYGIFFMIVNSFALASLYSINKQLLKGMASSQATFLYKFVVFFSLAIWVLRKGFKGLYTPVLPLHIVRGFFSISGSLCFAYGLKHTDLSNATALGYTEQLLWAIFGVMFFKEKMTGLKLGAIITSFSAMLLVVFPTFPSVLYDIANGKEIEVSSFDYHYLFIVAAACFWAINSTIVKVLGTRSVKNEVQAFYGLMFQVLFAYPAAFFEWNWHRIDGTFLSYPTYAGSIDWSTFSINETQAIQIVLLALLYFVHTFAFYLSFKYAEMSTVAPFDYSRLIFTCLLGYVIMGTVPQHGAQYIGYGMIIASGVVIASSEKIKRRKMEKQLETQIENV